MKADSKEKVQKLIDALDEIIKKVEQFEEKYRDEIDKVVPKHRKSATNLVQYLALRSSDIRDMQNALGELSMSRLGKAEGHIYTSILAIRRILQSLLSNKSIDPINIDLEDRYPTIREHSKILKSNTKDLLGEKIKGSSSRIMVTIPSEGAVDKKLIHRISDAGMNVARINCAHDDEEKWLEMVVNIRNEAQKSKKDIRVAMDLGGPKLRTGALSAGPKVARLRPGRDDIGRIVQYPKVFMGKKAPESNGLDSFVHLPMDIKSTDFDIEDRLSFTDTRGKKCILKVSDVDKNGVWAFCSKSAYVYTGMIINNKTKNKSYILGELPPIERSLSLKPGDLLNIVSENMDGAFMLDEYSEIPSIPCAIPEVFNQVKAGQKVIFDDDKIEAIIRDVKSNSMVVEIIYAANGLAKLRSEKGMNFPESKLNIRGLTNKDKEDLVFVVKHADIVNLSFVNSKEDIKELFSELKKHNREDIGIILKIETYDGFKNLPRILLKSMQLPNIGVMLARGDLAIEVGWENLGNVQEEILRICEAAHIPVIWATQVLETQAKKGRPSRAEISDVIMAERAECVMLNKGPHIEDTIRSLELILHSMEAFQNKKATLLPALKMDS